VFQAPDSRKFSERIRNTCRLVITTIYVRRLTRSAIGYSNWKAHLINWACRFCMAARNSSSAGPSMATSSLRDKVDEAA